jgi:hypothetical protein
MSAVEWIVGYRVSRSKGGGFKRLAGPWATRSEAQSALVDMPRAGLPTLQIRRRHMETSAERAAREQRVFDRQQLPTRREIVREARSMRLAATVERLIAGGWRLEYRSPAGSAYLRTRVRGYLVRVADHSVPRGSGMGPVAQMRADGLIGRAPWRREFII